MPANPSAVDSKSAAAHFEGFALPTSNTTYTPNQFFDVCLPHYSRGCVRLVAYMVRKTLGWCDEHGRPQAEQHRVSFNEFQQKAGISREMIKGAVEEAMAGHFIGRVELGAPNRAGKRSATATYELLWDECGEYVKDPKKFRGFFAGQGNRTYIPNQFFDVVIPNETLASVKVVGSIIRFSIGFQNKFGHRRQIVSLSYQDIQNYSKIRNRGTLSAAIEIAMDQNYIQRVEQGYFDKNAGRLSRAAIYGVKWLNQGPVELNGQKNVPGEIDSKNRSEKRTGNGQKNVPDERSEKRTDIQIKQTNKTLKQQGAGVVAFERLRREGFDPKAAEAIASKYPAERIDRQIEWLEHRRIKRNRLGLLRAAIEHDWSPPRAVGELGAPNSVLRRESGSGFSQALEQVKLRVLNSESNHSRS